MLENISKGGDLKKIRGGLKKNWSVVKVSDENRFLTPIKFFSGKNIFSKVERSKFAKGEIMGRETCASVFYREEKREEKRKNVIIKAEVERTDKHKLRSKTQKGKYTRL